MKAAIAAGRLEESSWRWLNAVGACRGQRRGRSLAWADGDLEVLVVRGRDIPPLLLAGVVDVALLGRDVAEEAGEGLAVGPSLGFGACRLMLAVPTGMDWRGRPLGRVATRYPQITRRWLASKGEDAEVIPLSGSVEVAPRLGLADAIVDIVETGETLRANGLEPVELVLESYAALVTRRGEEWQSGRLKGRNADEGRDRVAVGKG
jgi:ATP phosphoribosyltransferase